MHYDWQAVLAYAAISVAITLSGRMLVFRSAALREMRAQNDAADAMHSPLASSTKLDPSNTS